MIGFKWLICDAGPVERYNGRLRPTREQRFQIGDRVTMLVPKEFGGKAAQFTIKVDESTFDRPAVFAGVDVYRAIAHWNRKALAARPDFPVFEPGCHKAEDTEWYKYYSDLSMSPEEVTWQMAHWRHDFEKASCCENGLLFTTRDFLGHERIVWGYRNIGIALDGDLPFPPKFAKNPESVYENCPGSLCDPDVWY